MFDAEDRPPSPSYSLGAGLPSFITFRSTRQPPTRQRRCFARDCEHAPRHPPRCRFGRAGRALARPPRAPAPPGEAGTPPIDRALPRSHVSSHDSTRSAPPLAAAVGHMGHADARPGAAALTKAELSRRPRSGRSSLLLRSRGHPERQTAPGHSGATKAMPANLWQEPTLWAEAIVGCGEAPWPALGGIAAQACPILSRDQ